MLHAQRTDVYAGGDELRAVGGAQFTRWLEKRDVAYATHRAEYCDDISRTDIRVIPDSADLFRLQLLEERVRPGWYSMVVAFAAGLAGMLAVIRNRTDALIGAIASVALVPAGGAAGIAMIAGDPGRALGGAVLLTINVLLIVATGMTVLLAIGRGR